jgi:hypothetical protein
MGRKSAFSYSASRYSYSYSKTPESIQVDHLFREAATPLFGPFVNEIPILLFEYEYRFTQYEYEKNHWYELLGTIMPDGPKFSGYHPSLITSENSREKRAKVRVSDDWQFFLYSE